MSNENTHSVNNEQMISTTKRSSQKETLLGEAHGVQVIHPAPAAIPLQEGVHLAAVNTEDRRPWRQEEPKILLRMAYFALLAAKMIAEGRFTEDLWANIHFNAHPLFERGVNVFGRNPESETAWGKPVTLRENGVEESLPPNVEEQLSETINRYLPQWERLFPIALFSDGVEEITSGDESFMKRKEAYADKHEELLWANKKFDLVLVSNPHLSGLHLIVHPNQEYWHKKGGFKRPWQILQSDNKFPEHVQGFLEATSIVLGAERVLLEEGKLPFYNPEIHFSGNWSMDLLPKDKGGKLDMSYLSSEQQEQNRKEAKQVHRVGKELEWRTAMHGHLYATRSPDEYVTLPSRPQQEVPDQWKGIMPLSVAETTQVKVILQQDLTYWLEQSVAGRLQ